MKNKIFAVLLLSFCVLYACKESPSSKNEVDSEPQKDSVVVSEAETNVIDIVEVKLGPDNWSDSEFKKYQNGKKLTQEERTQLKIDDIKGEVLNKQLKNNELARGKAIYQGNNGRIESVVYGFEENGSYEFYEFIVSYDKSGSYIDHLQVGHNPLYHSAELSAVIKGDSIKTKLYCAEDMDYPETTTYTVYKIDSDLKFTKK